jgi:small-conductance mechanosensitive channel/CRP-like cAMP-binding protein
MTSFLGLWSEPLPSSCLILLFTAAFAAYRWAVRKWHRLPGIPSALVFAFLGARLVHVWTRHVGLPLAASWSGILADVLLVWVVIRLVFDAAVEYPMRRRGKGGVTRITRDFVLFICFGVAALVLLRTQGNVNLAGLITTSAVLTVVLGLAAQSTLSSFFAGLSLQLDRPFSVGDWLQYGDITGRVVGITWKSTRLLTRENVLIYVANSEIESSVLKNYSKPNDLYVATLPLGLDYEAPPNLVRRVVLQTLEEQPQVQKSPAPEVRLVGFGDFAINYQVRFWSRDFANEGRVLAEINNRLWYALRRHGLRIPFPIRDVRLAHVERRRDEQCALARRRAIADLLPTVPILQSLSDDERGRLAAGASIRDFGAGESIVREGAPGESLFIIGSGRCEVTAADPGGAERPLARVGRGDFFGEMSLLTGEPRSATVRAVEDTTVMEIDKALFAGILAANPQLATQLAEVLARRQAELKANAHAGRAGASGTHRLITRIKGFFGLG